MLKGLYESITAFLTNPIVGLVGFLLAILGTLSSWYFYRKGLFVKVPIYGRRSVPVISEPVSRLGQLSIKFAGQPVDRLTITRFLVVNDGRQAIRKEDLAQGDPLRLEATSGTTIYDVQLQYARNPANVVRVREEGVSRLIEFDFLNRREGFVVQVLHSGVTGREVELRGTFKDAGAPRLMSRLTNDLTPPKVPDSTESSNAVSTRWRRVLQRSTKIASTVFTYSFHSFFMLIGLLMIWTALSDYAQNPSWGRAIGSAFLCLVGATPVVFGGKVMWNSIRDNYEEYDSWFNDTLASSPPQERATVTVADAQPR